MDNTASRTASVGGAIVAAVAASACCVGPLIFAVLGIGGAGALVALEPYRPVFLVVTAALLGVGFYLTYRKPKVATVEVNANSDGEGDDCGCEMPATNKAGKRMLWVATGIVVVALAFPYVTPFLF